MLRKLMTGKGSLLQFFEAKNVFGKLPNMTAFVFKSFRTNTLGD